MRSPLIPALFLACLGAGAVLHGADYELIAAEYGGDPPAADWVAALGVDPNAVRNSFSTDKVLTVQLIGAKEPTGILWPGEQPELTVHLGNAGADPITGPAKLLTIQYESWSHEGEIFKYGVSKVMDGPVSEISIDVPAKGVQVLTLKPPVPERFGGHAVLLEVPGRGRFLITSLARTFKTEPQKRQFYKLTMDLRDPQVLTRLGAAPNRIGMSPRFGTPEENEKHYQEQAARLRVFAEANLPIAIEFGHGVPLSGAHQPLGDQRGKQHVDAQGKPGGVWDVVWMPSRDQEFIAFAKRLLMEFGWPKGPVNAVKIWNEPWNGGSIAGWGADDERFRELTLALNEAVVQARREGAVQVLQGGTDSSSNTLDKLFSDGSDRFTPMFDFLSIHYQGTDPFTNYRPWRERKGPDGKPNRVLIWDTESWVGNTDDRICSVLSSMYSFGQDRAVGIQSEKTVVRSFPRKVVMPDGTEFKSTIMHAFGPAAAVGAFQRLVDERPFVGMLWRGLPFVMHFDGETQDGAPGDPEDGTIVVLGDMGFFGRHSVAFRNVRSLAEVARDRELRRQLASPDIDAKTRADLEAQLRDFEPYRGCTMSIAADGDRFGLLDFYGNPIPPKDGVITIPLNERGYYLRGNGKPGSFAALRAAIAAARIDGYEPLEAKCHDMTAPIASGPVIRLELRNILNRPIDGSLNVSIPGLQLDFPARVAFAAHEMKMVDVRVVGGVENAENRYPLHLLYDAGNGVIAEHHEDMRVNWISRRTIAVDGDLTDWAGAIPQTITVDEAASVTTTERAWKPFETYDTTMKKGFSQGYLAWDDAHFYFSAKIADASPHPGVLRFATRDDDEFFYPEVSYKQTYLGQPAQDFSARWSGFLAVQTTGVHEFRLRRTCAVRLWIGDQLIIDDWANRGGVKTISGDLPLQAGARVPIRIEFAHFRGDPVLQFRWIEPSMPARTVPARVLFRAAEGDALGLQAEFFANATLAGEPAQRRIDPNVDYKTFLGAPAEATFGPGVESREEQRWPEGVRRYSYWKGPLLPNGSAPDFDNILLGFNVLPLDRKPFLESLPGCFPDYLQMATNDYEWALNTVAESYGGGTEVWRLRRPDMPHKHFYPRTLKAAADGPAPGAKLVTRYAGGWRITEAAIPWSEMPEAKARLDAGETVMFSYRVNDDQGVGCMELSKRRSVAKQGLSFFPDWKEHWTNQMQFAGERPKP